MVHKGDRHPALRVPIEMSVNVQNQWLDKRKVGGRKNVMYRVTSPAILSAHSVGHGMTRESRKLQLAQYEPLPLHADDMPFPESHLPPEADAKTFEEYLGITNEEEEISKRSRLYKTQQLQKVGLHERDGTKYLSPYEYEHQILDSMNASRGLNPKKKNPYRSRHTRVD